MDWTRDQWGNDGNIQERRKQAQLNGGKNHLFHFYNGDRIKKRFSTNGLGNDGERAFSQDTLFSRGDDFHKRKNNSMYKVHSP